jgi:TolA-binding protein
MNRGRLTFLLLLVLIMGVLPGLALGEDIQQGNSAPYGIDPALKAYSALDNGALQKTYDQGTLASYPGKDKLVEYGDQLIPELEKMIFDSSYDYQRTNFALDLLGSIHTAKARETLLKCATDDNVAWLPVTVAALNQNKDLAMIKSLMNSLVKQDGSPSYSVPVILAKFGDMAADESNRFYLSTAPGDERRIQLISVLSSSVKGRTLLMDDFHKIADRQEKNLIIDNLAAPVADYTWITPPTDRDRLVSWLRQVAAGDDDASCRQEALAGLYNAGDKTALAKLAADTEKYGTFRENGFWGWKLLYALNQNYPNSFIARGIAEYERIRGIKYFVINRPSEDGVWWGYEYGDKQYNPDVEIPGFEAFLANYPGHPATDSASYRLGRCYEIRGRYAEALNLLLAASQSPNGALKWDASQRVVYVADVVMNEKNAAEALASGKLNPALVPLVEYSRAVKVLRANDYAQADNLLTAFIDKYKGQDVYSNVAGWGPSQWDFWTKVEGQRDLARSLAALFRDSAKSGEEGHDAEYKLAAAIYHDNYVYYNHFWQGGRILYLWMGHIAETYDDPAEQAKIKTFLMGHNNYYQALNLFKTMQVQTGLSREMQEKVDYDVALCYLHLKDYGSEIRNLYTEKELDDNVVESLKEFIAKYPNSEMMAKALLALGLEEPDKAPLLELIQKYPDSKEADTARQYLSDQWFWRDQNNS